jgi:hypothetical protein
MRRRTAAASLVLAVASILSPGPKAAVDVTLDAPALDSILAALAPAKVVVPLPSGPSVTLRMDDLHVISFDPNAGDGSAGHILTALRLKVPELGIDVPVRPRLSLQVRSVDGKRTCYLRFEKVEIPMPITGSVNVAPLLPLLPIHSDQAAWIVAGSQGNVRVQPRLVDAKLGQQNLRLSFDLEFDPVAGAGS